MPSDVDRQRPQIFDWLATAAVAALLVADLFLSPGENRLLRAMGAGFLVVSVFFFVPPFYLLGKHGRVEKGRHYFETTALVDRGVYGIVRHPQYLGYCLLVFGFILRSQRAVTGLLGGLAVVLLYFQALREERFCAMQLGAEYEEYSRRVPRFNFVKGIVNYLRRWLRASR